MAPSRARTDLRGASVPACPASSRSASATSAPDLRQRCPPVVQDRVHQLPQGSEPLVAGEHLLDVADLRPNGSGSVGNHAVQLAVVGSVLAHCFLQVAQVEATEQATACRFVIASLAPSVVSPALDLRQDGNHGIFEIGQRLVLEQAFSVRLILEFWILVGGDRDISDYLIV